MGTTVDGKAAEQLRAEATAHDQAAADSFARCDTDGFLSQWSSGLAANKARAKAQIAEDGGKAVFPALFDLDGNLVPAKLISTRYGMAWGLLSSDDPHSPFTGYVNCSNASTEEKRDAALAKKGYAEHLVWADADADYSGSGGTGLAGALSVSIRTYRTDGGFSREVTLVDES